MRKQSGWWAWRAVTHESSLSVGSVPLKAGRAGWESKIQSAKPITQRQHSSCTWPAQLMCTACLLLRWNLTAFLRWFRVLLDHPVSNSFLSPIIGFPWVRGVLSWDPAQAIALPPGAGQTLPFRSPCSLGLFLINSISTHEPFCFPLPQPGCWSAPSCLKRSLSVAGVMSPPSAWPWLR